MAKAYRLGRKPRPSKGTFGSAALVLYAEDDLLREALNEDQQLVENARKAMQANLDEVAKSFARTGRAAQMQTQTITQTQRVSMDYGRTLRYVYYELQIFAGSMGTAASSAATLGSGLLSMGKAALGLPGIILAVGAALGGIISHFVNSARAAKEAAERYNEYAESARKLRSELRTATLGAEWRAARGMASVQSPREAALTIRDTSLAELGERAKVLRREMIPEEMIERLTGLPTERLQMLRRQQDAIIREAGVAHEQYQQTIERLDAEQRDKELREAKEHAEKLARTRAEAFERYRRMPVGILGEAIGLTIRQRQQEAAISRMLDDPLLKTVLNIFGLTKDVRRKAGLATQTGQTVTEALRAARMGGAGPSLALGAFPASGIGVSGRIAAFSDEQARARQEKERTTNVATITQTIVDWIKPGMQKIVKGAG